MNPFRLVLFVALVCVGGEAALAATQSHCPAAFDKAYLTRKYSGEYRNPAYGYSVSIPTPLIGLDVDNPLYQRGFILLFSDPQESIRVYADVNSPELQDLGQAADAERKFTTGLAAEVLASELKRTVLGQQAAIQYTTDYLCKDDQTQFSSITVVSLSPDKRFVYGLRWEGKKSDRDAGYKILQALISSWKFQRPKD